VCVGVYASTSEKSAFIVGETSKDANAAEARTSGTSGTSGTSSLFFCRTSSAASVVFGSVASRFSVFGVFSGRVSRRLARAASDRASRGSCLANRR
jgi:hypothetical protein